MMNNPKYEHKPLEIKKPPFYKPPKLEKSFPEPKPRPPVYKPPKVEKPNPPIYKPPEGKKLLDF
ncbi:hypothetical protein SLEP1_g29333 [Rubroshorea leprosula]|uniref:Uncharacterized protein n=1 Tax=Rubroshorea leprosula TaxID=152421 RepID=A0AAV5K2P8_9ROSI|nr:hypothetical protein SLEP1_g29333 [Rubroshorea leprosula]